MAIDRSRHGDACPIVVGRDPPAPDWREPDYRDNRFRRLQAFARTVAAADSVARPPCADLERASPLREMAVALMCAEVLPFLDQAQGADGLSARPAIRNGVQANGMLAERLLRFVLFGLGGRRSARGGYALLALFWLPMIVEMASMTPASNVGRHTDGTVADTCRVLGMETASLVPLLTRMGGEGMLAVQIGLVAASVGIEALVLRWQAPRP